MNKLIIIKGFLATGKTTYKNKLAAAFNMPSFDKDTIKETLSNEIDFTNRGENKKLSVASMAIMQHIFNILGNLGINLILESNFHAKEISQIKKAVDQYKYEVLVLDFKADYAVLYERFNHRAKNENRHKTHLSMGFEDINGFIEYLEKDIFDFEFSNVIQVDASTFDYQNDQKLFKIIENFINS